MLHVSSFNATQKDERARDNLKVVYHTLPPRVLRSTSPVRLAWPSMVIISLTILVLEILSTSHKGAVTSIDPGVALTVLDQALSVQVTYGAVMLSFLGACFFILI